LTINALAASGALRYRRLEFLAASLVVPGILLMPLPIRRRKKLFAVVILGALGAAVACGGGSSTQQQQPPPPVTYVVSVTGTSGVAHSVNVTVTAP